MQTADELRDLARRARRLAQNLSDADRKRLLAHAQELERQAMELEQRTDPSRVPSPTTQAQVQVQQQQQTGPPPDPAADSAANPQDRKPRR